MTLQSEDEFVHSYMSDHAEEFKAFADGLVARGLDALVPLEEDFQEKTRRKKG
jgi:hypothetical protein